MKPNAYLLIVVCNIILLQSCDHVYDSRINNESSTNISVIVFYDRQKLDSIYNFDVKSYNAYLSYFTNTNNLPFHSFDSTNLTATYTIPKNSQLIVEHGMNSIPNYLIIKKIQINANEKITVYENQSLNTVFEKKNSGLWELTVK